MLNIIKPNQMIDVRLGSIAKQFDLIGYAIKQSEAMQKSRNITMSSELCVSSKISNLSRTEAELDAL